MAIIMKKKNLFLIFSLFSTTLLVLSCRGMERKPAEKETGRPSVLHVAAAANLSYVIPEFVDAFRNKHSEFAGTGIRVTKASSGSLTSQIRNGAPYDIFLAANTHYPQSLHDDGFTAGPPVVYAGGVPVLVFRQEIEGEKGIACLTDESVEKIAVAKPDLAPYGEAAIEILSYAGILKQVESKFVYGTSVTQTFQHTITVADAGFIAASLLYGEGGKELKKAGMGWTGFPDDAYNPAGLRQAMVLLDSTNRAAAVFFRFMMSEEAGNILKIKGYRVE